jgi:hypothetical protein
MARYGHLPIYKAALDVAGGFEKLVAGFSRYHKYTLGTDLRNGSRRVVEQVARANGARERLPELLALPTMATRTTTRTMSCLPGQFAPDDDALRCSRMRTSTGSISPAGATSATPPTP